MTAPIQTSQAQSNTGANTGSKSDSKAWSRAWSAAVREPASEFDWTELTVIEGEIPPALQGCLFQNGPGRLERAGQRAGHWFDGDGAILAVRFANGKAQAQYRYIQTAAYQAEEKAEHYTHKSYDMLAPGPWPLRLLAPFKNAANTSVLPLPDRLLALWEGGLPHALDLDSLETLGIDQLGGTLRPNQSYSAHPKVDPATGEIFNFAVQPGPVTQLCLYRSDATGRVKQQARLPLNGVPLIHDMVLAGPYLMICVPPVRMRLVPALLGLKSFGESLAWRPELGTEILIFDRNSLSLVSRSTTEPWFQWHYANGYIDEAGQLVVDLIRYPDFSSHEQLRTVAAGYVDGILGGQIWRLCLDPQTATLCSETLLYDGACEFPTVPPQQVGQRTDAIYFVAHVPERLGEQPGEFVEAIARLNPETQAVQLLDCGRQHYPFSPIYAPHEPNSYGPEGHKPRSSDASNSTDNSTEKGGDNGIEVGTERGWVLSLVFKGGGKPQTELWILDGETLLERPQCKLRLPTIIPFGFHGCWQTDSQS